MARQQSDLPTRKVIAQTIASIIVLWLVFGLGLIGLDVSPEALSGVEAAIVSVLAPLIAAAIAYLTPPADRDGVEE